MQRMMPHLFDGKQLSKHLHSPEMPSHTFIWTVLTLHSCPDWN